MLRSTGLFLVLSLAGVTALAQAVQPYVPTQPGATTNQRPPNVQPYTPTVPGGMPGAPNATIATPVPAMTPMPTPTFSPPPGTMPTMTPTPTPYQ